MCKHIAAVLYGIGVRFDIQPTLLFELRGVDFKTLIKKSITEKLNEMLKNATNQSPRAIDDSQVYDIFGV